MPLSERTATRFASDSSSFSGGELPLRLPDRSAHPLDELEDRLRRLLRKHECVDQVGFVGLGGAALDHRDRVLGARDDEINVGFRLLLGRGEGDELAVHAHDAHADERPGPRNVRDVKRRAGAGDREDVGGVHLVRAHHRRDDLGVLLEALGEEGTHRTIDESARQDLVVPLPPFALEETARDLSGGERLLDVVASEGKKSRPGRSSPQTAVTSTTLSP